MKSLTKLVAAPVLAALFLLAPTAAHAKKPFKNIPVTGTFGNAGTFSGVMNIVGFVNDNGALKAIGLISGRLNGPAGAMDVEDAMAMIPVRVPALENGQCGASAKAADVITQQQAACSILHLDLGPLDLNLLGLVVHLDEVILDISAQPGAGNLLGNLLCAITGLLNGFNLGNILQGALTNVLTNLLNNLLGITG